MSLDFFTEYLCDKFTFKSLIDEVPIYELLMLNFTPKTGHARLTLALKLYQRITVLEPGDSRWFDSEKFQTFCWYCNRDEKNDDNLSPENSAQTSEEEKTIKKLPLTPMACFESEIGQGEDCAKLIFDCFHKFKRYPLFGIKANRQLPVKEQRKEWEWINYETVWNWIQKGFFATKSLMNGSNDENSNTNNNNKNRIWIAVIGSIGVEYIVCLLIAVIYGAIVVPLDSVMEDSVLEYILNTTQPSLCFIQQTHLERALKISHSRTHFITINNVKNEKSDDKILTFDQFLRVGDNGNAIKSNDLRPVNKEEVSAVLYTSGSTGNPKGVIFTESLLLPTEGITVVQPYIRIDFQTFDPTYLLSIMSTIQLGGCRALSSVETIVEDLSEIRPTNIGATPIFWIMLYKEYLSRVQKCLNEEQTKNNQNILSKEVRKRIDAKVAGEMKDKVLGGRLYVATSGGASVSRTVLTWAREKLNIDIVDLYGSRETGGISKNGVVYKGVKIKIMPVEGLDGCDGIQRNGKVKGEICVFSPRMVSGYYGNKISSNNEEDQEKNDGEDLNKKAFVEVEGIKYYRTGDIGESWTDEKGDTRLKVIERSGFVYKQMSGEWVSPSKIETILESYPAVRYAFVMGSGEHLCPVAIVVVKKESKVDNEKEEELLKKELKVWCVSNKLKTIEIPQGIKVFNEEDEEEWSVENGMMTVTMKKKRRALEQKYKNLRDELFQNLKTQKSNDLKKELNHNNNNNNNNNNQNTEVGEVVSDEFMKVLNSVSARNLSKEEISSQSTIVEIGGDSLGVARLARKLQDDYNLQLTSKQIYDSTIFHLSNLFDIAIRNSRTNSFTSLIPTTNDLDEELIDYEQESQIPQRLIDLYQSKILQDSLHQQQFQTTLKSDSHNSNGILVTGCTGFLGPFLVRQILDKNPHSKVYCLVRSSSDASARTRLLSEMKNFQLQTSDLNSETTSSSRLQVWAADFLKDGNSKFFGLSSEQYEVLRSEITEIYHSGALVNMDMPYHTLKSFNVTSTFKIIELALNLKQPLQFVAIHFISSIGALPSLLSSSNLERQKIQRQKLEDFVNISNDEIAKKSGYSQTKVVCEKFLHNVSQTFKEFKLINILRVSAISGHSITGAFNKLDLSSMIIKLCLELNAVPENCKNIKWNWISVDFVVKTIVELSRITANETPGKVWNVSGKGVTVEQIMDVAEKNLGWKIERIKEQEWKKRVKDRIEKKEKQKEGEKEEVLKEVMMNMNWRAGERLKEEEQQVEVEGLEEEGVPVEQTKHELMNRGIEWNEVKEEDIERELRHMETTGFIIRSG